MLRLRWLTGCAHVVHTRSVSLPASGLRLETPQSTDKKNSEVYFLSASKKILTQNLNWHVPPSFKETTSEARLTGLWSSRNFASGGAVRSSPVHSQCNENPHHSIAVGDENLSAIERPRLTFRRRVSRLSVWPNE
jgi:hypothetical protein